MTTKRTVYLFASIAGGLIVLFTLLVLISLQSSVARAERMDSLSGIVRYVSANGSDALNDCTNSDAPCRTVQHAVDVSQDSDEICVATGTYADAHPVIVSGQTITPVVFITKTVFLRGGYVTTNWETAHPITQPTTLDAQRKGPVIYISTGSAPTIDGFIITNGDGKDVESCGWSWVKGCGGGIYAKSANPIISNNVITGNIGSSDPSGYGWGGGIHIRSSGADTQIFSNTIVNNIASTTNVGQGGGILLYATGYVLIENNRIEGNIASTFAEGYGGGIASQHSSPFLFGNVISNNVGSSAIMKWADGAGLYFQGGRPILDSNQILSNTGNPNAGSSSCGGGVEFWVSGPFTLTNNIIAKNSASYSVSGIRIEGSTATNGSKGVLINNTVVQNGSGPGGEGIWVGAYSTITLTNNIIVSQTTGLINTSPDNSSVIAQYNLFWANGNNPITGTNAVLGNPALVNAFSNDYHLMPNSAAIDRGTNAGITTDFDGNSRPQGNGFDIGAFEFLSPPATLAINYSTGMPGSFFTLTGTNYPPNSTATIVVNGHTLGTIPTDSSGGFEFILNTDQADEGHYIVTASVNPSASTRFVLDSSEPIRSQEGSGTVFDVPGGIAYTQIVYLPIVRK